mmetsp:Transcript_27763/g.60873  ORF Transcript_27763/g.60873 Transcript_27763/m.60873 type:complete len:82 (-) Transcript_27763:1693-1938(-)
MTFSVGKYAASRSSNIHSPNDSTRRRRAISAQYMPDDTRIYSQHYESSCSSSFSFKGMTILTLSSRALTPDSGSMAHCTPT